MKSSKKRELGSDDYSSKIRQKLAQYVNRILDLSQRNRAIYFAVSTGEESGWKQKTIGFKLSNNVLNDLVNNREVTILKFSVVKNEFQGGCIDVKEGDWKSVENDLRRLYVKHKEFLKDYGISLCYLVYGFLIWREGQFPNKESWVKSPLFVAEVNLERKLDRRRGRITYQLSLETPFRLNESLMEMLRLQYEINFANEGETSGVETIEFEDIPEIESAIKKIEETISEFGWKIERESWVAALYFGTTGIYYDAKYLLDSGRLENSPIIRALCGDERVSPPPPPKFPSPMDKDIDQLETPLPADRSQTEVILYAEKGANIIVHGPPGTGKSQTIANLISRAIKNGKRVLLVAEKREAIDVVYSRLEELKLTKPVLKIFTVTSKERDQVLKDLLDTIEYILQTSLIKPASKISFPKTEYEYEKEYFELLMKNIESKDLSNLYGLIGECTVKEWQLERWGLLSIANKYYDSEVWKYIQSIDELILKSYWKYIIEFFKLPFIPTLEKLNIFPILSSFLLDLRGRFGNINREDLIELIIMIKKLHEFLIDQRQFEILNACIKLDISKLQESYNLLTQLISGINRLMDIIDKLRQLPSREYLTHIQNQLQKYNFYFDRVLSREYKRVRLELEEQLDISRRLSHVEALKEIVSLINMIDNLKLEESEEKEKLARIPIKDIAPSIRDLIFPLERARLNNVVLIIRRVLDIKKQTKVFDKFEILMKDLYFLKEISKHYQKNHLDCIFEVLRSMPEYKDVETLLSTIAGFNKIFQKLSNIKLETFYDLLNQIKKVPKLETLISELPADTTYEQFKALLDYLMIKNKCDQIMDFEKKKLDSVIVEKCMERIKKFYNEVEQDFSVYCLSEWISRISEEINILYHTLRRECAKKRKKISLRILFERYLDQILKIKPILMMSIFAVSAILPRNFDKQYFDIVIFDEASQVRVETAIPSIARSKQLIVIGDEHQMPPGRYFERLVFFEGEGVEEGEELPESLLAACLNAPIGVFKELWLEWYYRGSHESLIAFSNKHFYNNRLIVLPSPNPDDSRVELVFNQCPNHPNGGCYIEGRAINPCEAIVVLKKVLELLMKLTNHNLTIGVVAMNERQQEVIEDLIQKICQETDLMRVGELLGINSNIIDSFVKNHGSEQLIITEELIDRLENMFNEDRIWIRNLESVQGKEADYIILSMTYGKGRDGKLRQQFGPINREGGERRINVLISRARERMIVVSSMKSIDLRVDSETPYGVRILRDFLKYAEEGGKLIEEREEITSFESPFEESVFYHLGDVLSDLGVEIIPQVGVGKYRIDLGIRKDGRYLLGIECDGALYHRHRAARERDRIRDDCLRRMGWEVYRIWSTSWFIKQHRTEILNEIRNKIIDKLNQTI